MRQPFQRENVIGMLQQIGGMLVVSLLASSVYSLQDEGADNKLKRLNKEEINRVFVAAACLDDFSLVKKCVAQGAVVDARDSGGNTALMWAADKQNRACVEFLVRNAGNVNA